MRAKLVLESNEVLLPYNYNYHLSSAIYSAFENADPDLADYLHRSKEIKLYTFSRLLIQKRKVKEDGLLIEGPVHLYISTGKELIMKAGIEGALSKGKLRVGDVEFLIRSIEILEKPNFSKALDGYIEGKTLSPVNTTTKRMKDGELKSWDLYPDDIQFYENLRRNLLKKYEMIHGEKPEDRYFDLKIREFKKERVKIRNTMHRASTFHFHLRGSPKLIKTAYDCGLGEKNSMGFGCIEVVGYS